MDSVKEAFKRVKEDINSIKQEMSSLKQEINYLHKRIDEENIPEIPENKGLDTQTDTSTDSTHPSTHRQINSTDSTHPSTDNSGFKPLNGQNLGISTGNKGVSTDRQTHRQTHRQTGYTNFRQENSFPEKEYNSQQNLLYNGPDSPTYIDYSTSDINNTNNQPNNNGYTQQSQEFNHFQKPSGFQSYQNTQTSKTFQNTPNTLEYPERQPSQHSTPVKQEYENNKIYRQHPLENQKPIHYSESFSPQSHPSLSPQSSPQTSPRSQIQTTNGQEKQGQEQESMNNALEILNSLDSLKKEIRFKFKKLTDQEMSVFSTLYQLNEEGEIANYKSVSHRLNLSESSIRDYVGRLMKKGIPLEKKRINNKTIHLNISKELKNIATLPTILKLRDL